MSSIFSSFIQVFVALCLVAPVFGNPSRLTDCARSLEPGVFYMNQAAIVGDSTKIEIRSDAGQLRPNGADWFPGLTYTAKLTLDAGEQFVADFDTAPTTSINTRCDGKRVYQNSGGNQEITFQVPTDFTGTYTIRLGYTASRSAPVKTVFTTLVDPNAVVINPTPFPTFNINLVGGSCALCDKTLYYADCGAFSKATNECKSDFSDANCCGSSTGDCCELNDGLIAGVAVGAFVFVVLCIFGCYYACNCNGKNGGYNTAQNQEAQIEMGETGENGENGEEQVAVTGETAENNI